MKLVTFSQAGTTRIGIADGDEVVDLTVAAPELPREMVAFSPAAPWRSKPHAGLRAVRADAFR